MINPRLDGISHINVYSNGATELGRMLSNFTRWPMMTEDGEFVSVEGYWHWLGVREDCKNRETLRNLFGYEAKKRGQELRKLFGQRISQEEFQNRILDAIWGKFKKNKDLLEPRFYELPFEHYYVFNGKVISAKEQNKWMIDGIAKMRDQLIEKV